MSLEHAPEHEDARAQDDLDRPLWGARAIGKEIGKGPRAVYHLAEAGLLDVDKCGHQLVSTPRRLRAQFAGGGHAPK